MNYNAFIAGVGAIAMGATTYEWIRARRQRRQRKWAYTMPTVVFTHRDLPDDRRRPTSGSSRGDVAAVHADSGRPAARTSGWSAAATSPGSSPTPGCSTRSCGDRARDARGGPTDLPAPLRPAPDRRRAQRRVRVRPLRGAESATRTVRMTGRDRLRACSTPSSTRTHRSLSDMAGGAYASPFHFSRRLARDAGEPPVAMRRRVALERAAWRLAVGASVTDAAFEAGYGSVEGFTRAFAPRLRTSAQRDPAQGRPAARDWLPAPNGIHFHAPDTLWMEGDAAGIGGRGRHRADGAPRRRRRAGCCWTLAKGLLRRVRPRAGCRARPAALVRGPEGSIAALLSAVRRHHEIWLASITGARPSRPRRPTTPTR